MILPGIEQAISQTQNDEPLKMVLYQIARAINSGTLGAVTINRSGGGTTGGGGSSSAEKHIESGRLTSAMIVGAMIVFSSNFAVSVSVNGDYSLMLRAYDAGGANVNVTVGAKSLAGATVYPDVDTVTIEWLAVAW